MTLISPEFAAFVALSALLVHAVDLRFRPALLCVVSVAFCAINSISAAVALLLASAGTFYAARWIERCSDEGRRRILVGAIVSILAAHLLIIKLLPHVDAGPRREWLTQLLAAFGASYYTLKLIGYLLDVFWRRYPAWTHPTEFAAFATFFPLLPAGPIQRANEFSLETDNGRIAGLMTYGLRRILLGLVKKLLVADRVGGIVDYIAGGQPQHANLLWVMFYLFPLQLYADFSALTDIGIGAAAIYGVRVPENFFFPFFARSISEFWRRWHMSLTRWLGDYAFTALRMATRRLGRAGLVISIAANMVLIGMWHAISFGWLLFGLINAVFLTADALTIRLRMRMRKRRPAASRFTPVLGALLVFHMVALSLVCFRAQTLRDIGYFFGNLLGGLSAPVIGLKQLFYSYGRGPCAYAFAALCVFMLVEGWLYQRARGWQLVSRLPRFVEWPRPLRWAAYYLALLLVGIASQQSSRFIYVQF